MKIICHRAHAIRVDEYHNPLPYNKWDGCVNPNQVVHQPYRIFPTGGAGALYPPHALHEDVTNRELFLKLAPKADDIWFWAMAVINKEYFGNDSPYIVIENGYSNPQSVDPAQEHGGNALWNYNVLHNDEQLKAVIKQYPQIKEYLQKIDP